MWYRQRYAGRSFCIVGLIQYASKQTFRTVGNKRRLNGTVVLKKPVARRCERIAAVFSTRCQRINGSTSHAARSAILTHACACAAPRLSAENKTAARMYRACTTTVDQRYAVRERRQQRSSVFLWKFRDDFSSVT